MKQLDNEHFLAELARMFQKSRSSGAASVSVSMKRYDGRTKPRPRDGAAHAAAAEFKCLFHARSGSHKISTVVNPKEVNKFQQAYANVLKSNMDNLKKREKKADKEKKAARVEKTNA